jgi:hypothetical protein
MDSIPQHPFSNHSMPPHNFSIINLRAETEIKNSYFELYDYLVEYLKEVINYNHSFTLWYKTQSPEYSKMLDRIYNLVTIYYNYDHNLLSRDDICRILNEMKEKFNRNPEIKIQEVINPFINYFNPKVKQVITIQSLKFVNNEDLIKKKQKSMNDIFFDLAKSIYLKPTIIDYFTHINLIHADIIQKIHLFTSEEDSIPSTILTNFNKETIKTEINQTKRTILSYVYSKNLLHFNNYLHHLRNIYLGIRFYLQPGYMNKRFEKENVEVYNKFYCCVKDPSDQIILGMIVNKYKDKPSAEYLQEHIFISNNIKNQIFNPIKRKQLSLSLHSYASNLLPISKKIYCNPMPSMLKIFREANNSGKITMNVLSEEEKEEIKKKQIICFKFPPMISIDITETLQNFYNL